MSDPRVLREEYQSVLDGEINFLRAKTLIYQNRRDRIQAEQDGRAPWTWSRTLSGMATGGLNGPELEHWKEEARRAGVAFDPQRIYIPFSSLQQRDLTVGVPSAGGYLVGTTAQPARDIERPLSVSRALGVERIEGLHGNVTISKTTATATITWQSTEATSITPSTPTLGAPVTMSPHIAVGIINSSRQLLIQSDAERWIKRELLKTAAAIEDYAILSGAGGAEPLGVLNIGGIGTETGAGLSWPDTLKMKRLAAEVNLQDTGIAFVAPPATREILEGREKAAGNGWIWADDEIAGRPALATTQMPAGTLLSGPWGSVVFGIWGNGFELQANPYDNALFKTGGIQFRVLIACDVAVLCDPLGFTKAESVT